MLNADWSMRMLDFPPGFILERQLMFHSILLKSRIPKKKLNQEKIKA